jgi:glutathione S-transferase
MKLYLNKTSPYARLVMVLLHEKALVDRVDLIWTDPWASPAELVVVNPLAKVPALVTDDGQSIVESACICDYLEHLGAGRTLLPVGMPSRLGALRKYGLGRGLIDVAFGVTIDRRFFPRDHKSVLAGRWLRAAGMSIKEIERDAPLTPEGVPPDLGDLAIAVGLSYVAFRLPEMKWRESAPKVARWLEMISMRPSMQRTAPE